MTDPTPPGYRRTDPDETRGRLIYRQTAERDARMSIALGRAAKLNAAAPRESLSVEKEDE